MSEASSTLEPICTLCGHLDPRVWHVAWSPSGEVLASCGEDRSIRLWQATDRDAVGGEWRCVAILEDGHQRTIRWCEWAPDARYVASCSFDGSASVWEILDGDFDCVASLEGHENEVKAVSWSSSGQYLATCGRDKSVFIWEAEDEAFEVAAVLHAHAADVKAVAWHPRTDVLASASYDDTLKLYSQASDDWRCFSTLSAHTSTIWALAFSQDGRGLVSCSDDRSVILWRDTTGECAYVHAATLPEVHERAIYSVSWAREACSGLIATGGADDAICLLRPELSASGGTLSLEGLQPSTHSGDVNSVCWRPTPPDAAGGPRAGWLASSGDDGCVRLWRSTKPPSPLAR